jgi:hypothetical protein
MGSLFTLGSVVGALVAAVGVALSFHTLVLTVAAERELLDVLRKQAKVRDELISALVKTNVGEKVLIDAEKRLADLVLVLPKRSQRFLFKGLHQPSSRGRRDFMLKLATRAMTDAA